MKVFVVRGATGESAEAGALWDAGCLGLSEDADAAGAPFLSAYFAEEVSLPLEGKWQDAPDRDHVADYFAGLSEVRVPPLIVAPTHRAVTLTEGEKVVWLDPGTAFGTGHHETTRMALEALCRRELRDRTVLDVGTGSGLLAVAADALGAMVLGIDVDPHAVAVARENAALNRSGAAFAVGTLAVPGRDLALVNPEASDGLGDSGVFAPVGGLPGRFDVIVANLYAELHVSLMGAYASRLVPGGDVIVTGILGRLAGTVADAARASGLSVVRETAEGEWVLLELAQGA